MRGLVLSSMLIGLLAVATVAGTFVFAEGFTRVMALVKSPGGAMLPIAAPIAGEDLTEESEQEEGSGAGGRARPGQVNCAMREYGSNDSYVCFSNEFLAQINRDSHIVANEQLIPVALESTELFQFPFAVMTGEGSSASVTPTAEHAGVPAGRGFIIASAGCSSGLGSRASRRRYGHLSRNRVDADRPVAPRLSLRLRHH
ncbi:MAG: hypothetical protein R3B90_10365 [Planctomycetaceae bacterium]